MSRPSFKPVPGSRVFLNSAVGGQDRKPGDAVGELAAIVIGHELFVGRLPHVVGFAGEEIGLDDTSWEP